MSSLQETLCDLAGKSYDKSSAHYRFWLDLGRTRGSLTVQNQADDDMWRIIRTDSSKDLINPTTHIFIRSIEDAEADQKIAGRALGLHRKYCEPTLDRFFEKSLSLVTCWNGDRSSFFTDVNLIAHWINLGYVDEALTRDYVLPSLISHPGIYVHGMEALIILFKLAGATVEAYVGKSVVDRCFEGLKIQYPCDSMEGKLVQVRALRAAKRGHRAQTIYSGGICVTGAWLGGSPSPTCIHRREVQTSWRRPE